MVNNHLRGRVTPPFFFFLFSLLSIQIFAQNISKYYTASTLPGGKLYFIEPDSDFENRKESASLSYDLTRHTANDTVRMNFSFIFPEIIEIDSLVLVGIQKSTSLDIEKLFVEDQKEDWIHRYSAQFLAASLNSFFQSETPPGMLVYFNNSFVPLEIKKGKWKKDSAVMRKIFQLMSAN
jgi:hypothetical protein